MSTLEISLPEAICARAQSLAQNGGVPLDHFIANALAEKIAALDAENFIEKRARRGNREKFDRVLSKVPDVDPDEVDRIFSSNGG